MFLFVAQSFFFFLGTCNQKNHTIDTRSDVIPSPERIRTWVICLAGARMAQRNLKPDCIRRVNIDGMLHWQTQIWDDGTRLLPIALIGASTARK